MAPWLVAIWRAYERANERSRMAYYQHMGTQRQIRDQSGRVRATKQVR